MDVTEVHMTKADILTILTVFENLDQTSILSLDIVAITNSLKRFDVINEDTYHFLLQKYIKYKGTYINKLYSFVRYITNFVTLYGFARALEDAGYVDICNKLILERQRYNTVSRGVMKRELSNAKEIQTYYAGLKRYADNNLFENRTDLVLKKMITDFDSEIVLYADDLNRKQLLVDKRSVLYFLLSQQCSNISNRNAILKRMRDSMPHDVDRTIFDTIFHSYMALNWAMSGNVTTAEKHEKQALVASNSCVAGFVTVAMNQWAQYKNNALYLQSGCRANEFLRQARANFQIVQQCLEEFNEEEKTIWRTISLLDMARSLLGINLYLEVCDIERIGPVNIEHAREILNHLQEPTDIRRKMYYFIIRGRLNELTDRVEAKKCVQNALSLACDGCYYEIENRNIQKYLESLVAQDLPRPSI